MAFESLSEKLQGVFKKLRGKGVLTETDIDEAMREVKLALLEADVGFKIVKQFIESVKEKAKGKDVMESLTPAQQVLKIVKDELVGLMGGVNSRLTYSPKGFTVIMLVGLQGSGKTTTCGKLANYLKKIGKKPMLAACDVYRPAAIDQLEIVGKSVDAPVFVMRESEDPVEIAEKAVKEADYKGFDVLIIDTAGRLQIDEALMGELVRLKKAVRPHEILLVMDAMMGQDAVNAAAGFNGALGVDGVIMTKLDGDTRGGAALSAKTVTQRPIKFIGSGEKFDALEAFHPERMASRILGMGDVMSLIEKAQENFDDAEAEKLERKIKKNEFTLEDFLEQIGQIRKMGGIGKLIGMLPGIGGSMKNINVEAGEKEFKQMEAIICSMTKEERRNPSILNSGRRKRVAAGSGQTVQKINILIKRYEEARKMMKSFMGGSKHNRSKIMKNFGGFNGI
ncbi:MAG: signal recognition particle protein [Clostridiales Family XIII bacterium]|jgi:signal recognition particle subunit SRP54|nr:signal recognition particle protein [Clostridiales Family XIII bacterium]